MNLQPNVLCERLHILTLAALEAVEQQEFSQLQGILDARQKILTDLSSHKSVCDPDRVRQVQQAEVLLTQILVAQRTKLAKAVQVSRDAASAYGCHASKT